jgi:hypothetical protein
VTPPGNLPVHRSVGVRAEKTWEEEKDEDEESIPGGSKTTFRSEIMPLAETRPADQISCNIYGDIHKIYMGQRHSKPERCKINGCVVYRMMYGAGENSPALP